MADDTYTRSFSFAGFQNNRPNLPLPGQRVDIELDNIARALAALGLGPSNPGSPGGNPGNGGGSGGGPLTPIPAGTLLANLSSSTAIPMAVTIGAFKSSFGLGTAASLNVGEPGGVASYDDPRFGDNADISGFLTKAGNLAGLADVVVARQNLGLGTAATCAFGISGGVASFDDMRFNQVGGNTYGSVDPMKDFGAKGDGTTDDSAAWQAAVDSRKPIRPSKPPVAYLINTPVLIRGKTIIQTGSHGNANECTIRTTANVDTFTFNADIAGVVIKGIAFEHTGPTSGRILNMNNAQGCIIEGNNFRATGNVTTSFDNGNVVYNNTSNNTSDLIFCGGGLNWFSFNYFDNFRKSTDAFCVAFDKRLAQANHCIENHVEENYAGGAGPFVYAGSREARDQSKYSQAVGSKPEGLHIKNNSVQTFAPSLVIESGLLLHITGNSFAIANGSTVIIRPTGPGVIDLRSNSNWYDSTGNRTGGSIIAHDDAYYDASLRPAAVFQVARFDDYFYVGNFGVTLQKSASNVNFSGSHFQGIAQAAISCDRSQGITLGCSFSICGRAFTLIDGPSGGPFFLGTCSFDPGMAFDLVLTDRNKFYPSYDTRGLTFARKFGRLANTNTMTAGAVAGTFNRVVSVAHGLSFTPNPSKCFCTIQLIGDANFEGAFAMIVSADATNVVVKIFFAGVAQNGNYTINCDFSS